MNYLLYNKENKLPNLYLIFKRARLITNRKWKLVRKKMRGERERKDKRKRQ